MSGQGPSGRTAVVAATPAESVSAGQEEMGEQQTSPEGTRSGGTIALRLIYQNTPVNLLFYIILNMQLLCCTMTIV